MTSRFARDRWLLLCALLPQIACSSNAESRAAEPSADADAGLPRHGSGSDGGTDGGAPPTFGGLAVTTTAAAQALDLFGVPGHRFWLEVNATELAAMNGNQSGGPIIAAKQGMPVAYGEPREIGPVIDPGFGGDIYAPEGTETFADHVVIQDAATGSVADYGKMQVSLVGQSTFRPWTRSQIPNVHLDADQFQAGARIGTFEHVRLDNSIVGSIFREHVAHRVFRALGYPALRTSFAFLGGPAWGEGVWVPMTLAEVYKRRFCDDNLDLVGGACTNLWEFTGDAGAPGSAPECQLHDCDPTRMEALATRVGETPLGAGFRDALAEFVDWRRFHQFQCISWIVATWDDAFHAMNNNLMLEREDGRFVFAPYSVDISAGHAWSAPPPLPGTSTLARGCQADAACWADAIAECEDVVARFDALDPETIVDETRATLEAAGMMRAHDDERAAELREWYVERQTTLRPELENYRYLPDASGNCPDGLVLCNDQGCGTTAQCEQRRCTPGLVWCDAYQQCVQPTDSCPACEGATPLYCPANMKCMEGPDACTLACETSSGPGFVYCAATRQCAMPEWCGDVIGPPPIR